MCDNSRDLPCLAVTVSEPRDFDHSCRIRPLQRGAPRAFADNAFVYFLHTTRIIPFTFLQILPGSQRKVRLGSCSVTAS